MDKAGWLGQVLFGILMMFRWFGKVKKNSGFGTCDEGCWKFEVFGAVMDFTRQVCQGVRFRLGDELKKVCKLDFKEISCWDFCHLMKGMEDVRNNGKVLKFGDFQDELGSLRFRMKFECLGNLKMVSMKCGKGFWGQSCDGMSFEVLR